MPFWLLQLQSSGISLTQRLGTHFEYHLVTSCHASHLRGVNKQEAARADMAKVTATAKLAGERVPRKGKANTWGRARERDPQEGTYRQVLQMVQGCWQTVRDPRHHRVS